MVSVILFPTLPRLSDKIIVPTISATPDYEDADALGGVNEVTTAVHAPGAYGMIVSLSATWVGTTANPSITAYVFDSNPAASTFTDNAAISIHANDRAKLLGTIALGTFAAAGVNVAHVKDVNLPVKAASGSRSLFVAFRAGGAINAASTSDLRVRLTIARSS